MLIVRIISRNIYMVLAATTRFCLIIEVNLFFCLGMLQNTDTSQKQIVFVDKFYFHIVFIASSRSGCFRRHFTRHHF